MSDAKHDADVTFIKALAELLRENDLTELRVKRDYGEDDSLDVRVSRGVPPAPAAPPAPAPAPAAPVPAAAVPASGPADPGASSTAADPASDPGAVTSPMVGTAYLAAEPGGPPFVKVGDQVEEGQTLIIVEAMKTMNHIPSPRSGQVKQVIVADGAPVEYGAPLVILG